MDEQVITLLRKLAKLTTAIVKARRQVSPANPLFPAMNLNDAMKLAKEIKDLADGLEEPPPDSIVSDAPGTTDET